MTSPFGPINGSRSRAVNTAPTAEFSVESGSTIRTVNIVPAGILATPTAGAVEVAERGSGGFGCLPHPTEAATAMTEATAYL
jgi:hypothetical protein